MMQTLKIISLSVLYGFTALLPTSSLGHISLLNEIFQISNENLNISFYYSLFSIGAALAVYVYYFGIYIKMTKNILRRKSRIANPADAAFKTAGRNAVLSLLPVLTLFIPIGNGRFVFSLGEYFLTKDSLIFVGIASILCSVLMFISLWYIGRDYAEKTNLVSTKNAVFFGVYQIASYILPGVSHISLGASRTSVSDIDIKNVLKETYLYIAPAFLITGIVKTTYYYGGGEKIKLTVAFSALAISFVFSLVMLSLINRFFSKRAYKAFSIYTLVFGCLITATSLFKMFI